ncbi:hypothetical protein ABS71_05830 [bacterium SCN 62-11]|nr:hypothetical protein [Candidatus Eremiobacteraeota bacterium]ODT74304.1 MAG: hypothetical protein ABS71_05830 [bacterium SCN 62-11]
MAIGSIRKKDQGPIRPSWSRHSQANLRSQGQPDTFSRSEPQQFPQLQGRIQVGGHLLKDPQHSQYPSSRYEIRCYAPGPEGAVRSLSVEELVAAQKGPFQSELSFGVSPDSGRPRRSDESIGRIVPKDHSLRIDSIDMQYQHSGVNRRYFQQLTQVGAIENFQVRGLVEAHELEEADKNLRQAGCSHYQLSPGPIGAEWLEDYSEPLLGGGRVVPAPFSGGLQPLLESLGEARGQRFQPHGLSGDFSSQGSVQQGGYQRIGGSQAMVYGEKLYQAQSYVEGGNMLSGQRADGTPYLLVGQDSMDLTGALLEKKLGRTPSPEEVRQTVAGDYGVSTDQVFGIEQPGAFHLDMRMTSLAPGVIGLQDSPLAARLQTEWLAQEAPLSEADQQRLDRLAAEADQAARYEALTRRDLEKAGLQVVSMPGAFRNLAKVNIDGSNFFNGRHGTNPQGEKYTILMGGTAKQEEYLADFLLGQGHLQVDRLYFLDPEQNGQTLGQHGGLKCRTKPHGQV